MNRNPLSDMGKKEVILGAGLVAGIVALAVIFRSSPANAANKIGAQSYTITEANNGSTVALRVGDTLTINLSGETPAATSATPVDYLATGSGTTPLAMTRGAQVQTGAAMSATWTATSTGTATIFVPSC